MSSTRFKNDVGEYTLEQRINNHVCENRVDGLRTLNTQLGLPELGFNPSHIPSHQLSRNAIDVESQLYGIGTSNLVQPHIHVTPQLISNSNVSYFQKPEMILPMSFVHKGNQRPIIP